MRRGGHGLSYRAPYISGLADDCIGTARQSRERQRPCRPLRSGRGVQECVSIH